MEDKESTESGSLGGRTESESPPPVAVGGGEVVPELMNMAVNMSIVSSVGVNTAGSGVVSGAGFVSASGLGLGFSSSDGSRDLMGKKKRGRPRKYDSDGNLRAPYMLSSPQSPPPGFTLTSPSSEFGSKRGRGRPPGSGNWQVLASLGGLFADTAGGDFRPHVLTVQTGEDLAAKIISFAQKGPRGICIISANGSVSNVTIRQPGSSGGILTFEGCFEILTLTGSFTISENGGIKSRTGGLSVSLAGPDGRVIGGGIAGLLVAASPIQMVVGSFVPNAYKTHRRKHQKESRMPLLLQGPPGAVIPAKPISQAGPDGSSFQNPGSHFPLHSSGEAGNSTSNLQYSSSTATDSVDRNGSQPVSDQRPYPDINLSVPVE